MSLFLHIMVRSSDQCQNQLLYFLHYSQVGLIIISRKKKKIGIRMLSNSYSYAIKWTNTKRRVLRIDHPPLPHSTSNLTFSLDCWVEKNVWDGFFLKCDDVCHEFFFKDKINKCIWICFKLFQSTVSVGFVLDSPLEASCLEHWGQLPMCHSPWKNNLSSDWK